MFGFRTVGAREAWEEGPRKNPEIVRLAKLMDESHVRRKGPPDARRLVLEMMTRQLEPTAPAQTVCSRLAVAPAMARTMEQLGFDKLDFDELMEEAWAEGLPASPLRRIDGRKAMDMTLWEVLDVLTRPKVPRGRKTVARKEPPASED